MDTECDEQNNKDKQDDKQRKKRKPDVTDKDNDGDVTNGSEQEDKQRKKRKPDVENESVNVDQEEDKVIILKKIKITHSTSSAEEE